MPRNSNTDLQNHLFEIMERLKDGDMPIDQAKGMCEVAKQIIDAKKLKHDENVLKMKAFELIAEYNGKVDEDKLLGNGDLQ